MAKRLTDKQKEDIVKFFISGKSIDELSKDFTFTKSTIVRNLKKNLGNKKYEELINKSKSTRNHSVKIPPLETFVKVFQNRKTSLILFYFMNVKNERC